MTININIKANVVNLSLRDIYKLLEEFSINKQEVIEFKNYKFKVKAEIGMSIDYIITEIFEE